MTTTTGDATGDAATTVRKLLEAFLAGDVETFVANVDDNMEWNPADHHPFLTQQYRGREQYLGAAAKVPEVIDGFDVVIERMLGCGDVAVSQLRYRGKVRNTGRSFDLPAVVVWEVRDGKVTRGQEYLDSWAFMDAWNAGS
jgi:ketosteroid isomerase-like protein